MSRVLIVTGGSRGIGAAVSRLAANDGWDVCVNYVAHADRAGEVVDSVRACGRRAIAVAADVSREKDVLALFAACEDALGAPTGLVNNAGIITGFGRLDNLRDEHLRRTFEVNTLSYFLSAREAVRQMSTRHGGGGGVIVNVSSRAATLGMPSEYVHYAASKAAVNALTKGLALEVAAEGIRVASVSPGLIDTEIQLPERFARIAPTTPMRRAGTANEVAEAVVWLLSEKASYVTGADLAVTGGAEPQRERESNMATCFTRLIQTIDSHTEGNSTRVIVGGVPVPPGKTLLERRDWLWRNDDDLRRILNFEPRGHGMMCSVLVMPPISSKADVSIIMMEQDEYVPMCGHCLIGVATTLVANG